MADVDVLKERANLFVGTENRGDAKVADGILAPDFVCITRANGIEQGRDKLLEAIGAAGAENPVRTLDFPEPCSRAWHLGGDYGMVRGVVSTSKRETPGRVEGRFRNTYIS